jgi:hypothetical protein
MARLVIDLPENSPGCIYSTGQVRLPASVGLGTAAAGLRLIRPKRMRTRVGMLRRRAKNPGTAHGRRRDWSALFASTRIWRAFGSPRASAKPTKPVGSVAQPRIHCPPIRTAVPTPSWGSPECKAPTAMEAAIREAVTAEAAAVKAAAMKVAAMKAAAAVKTAAARAHRGGGTSRADDRDCQSRRGQHTEN